MSKKLIDNFGKKTYSKMSFQIWVTLSYFLENESINIFSPDLSGDALYIDKWERITIHEVKTDESEDDTISLKTNVKKSIRDLTLYNKNSSITGTFLHHTHTIKFNNIETKNNQKIPKEFGGAMVKYNGSKNPSIKLFDSEDSQPIFKKIFIKWDKKAIWQKEFKRSLNAYSEKLGRKLKMNYNQIKILSENIREFVESLMCIEANFKTDDDLFLLAEKNGLTRKQLLDRAKIIIETPKETDLFIAFLKKNGYSVSEFEKEKIEKSILEEFDIKNICGKFYENNLNKIIGKQYLLFKKGKNENKLN